MGRKSQYHEGLLICIANYHSTSSWLIYDPHPKFLVQSWTGPENFIKICSFHQKLFNCFSKTERHMASHPHTDEQKSLMHILDTFYFTTTILLTLFVKENHRDRTKASALCCFYLFFPHLNMQKTC
jgi:hypothetical protein